MDLLINILEGMGLTGYAKFFQFWRQRKQLTSLIPEENRHIVGLSRLSLEIIQRHIKVDPNISDMYLTFSEYIAYSLPPEGIKAIKKLIIETGKTLEAAEEMKDGYSKEQLLYLAKLCPESEFGKIERLL